jgi:hemerythrin superfamily protein
LASTRAPATKRAPATISEAIKNDHRELRRYYDEIVNHKGNFDHQDRYGNQFRWQLARHAVAEELLVYPALEKYLGDAGKALADGDREQHHKIKVLLKDFQQLNAADDAFIPKLEEIWTELSHHIEDEESRDLPDLESALASRPVRGSSDGDSESLAKKFERTKAFVPSRSHPSAGENPYFESAVGMLAAPIDRIADLFRKFPDDITDPEASRKYPDDPDAGYLDGRGVDGHGVDDRVIDGRDVDGRDVDGRRVDGRVVDGRRRVDGRVADGRDVDGRVVDGRDDGVLGRDRI